MMDPVVGMMCGVAVCFLITTVVAAIFHALVGFSGPSHRLLYFVGLFSLGYYIIKFPQLSSPSADCDVLEAFSVLLYLGAHVVLSVFFVIRNVEVYGWDNHWMIPVLGLIGGLCLAILVSLMSNTTTFIDGVCHVNHPPISAYLPSALVFAISSITLYLFLRPLLPKTRPKPSINATTMIERTAVVTTPPDPPATIELTAAPDPPTPSIVDARNGPTKRAIAVRLFVTTAIAVTFTIFFNATLNTPVIADYAPLISSLDLMLNHTMVCLPYLLTRWDRRRESRECGAAGGAGEEGRGGECEKTAL
ncbi:uncharacterized protein EV422DRAFT_272863 [Fimicolochytrium jonesii]|uniref:uncharacterized protein n=1 Tax=Fimicolochytrium jonesii TaxID=1396493 RepID=UPI0022FF0779|nr:uncharacterized protein EV422DRAFT_272863 [Fimicolochytrium jonesii]KAI8816871.1 hypothetical protein EV422DRAFT_272863 [Fimicolochytrium jonesii]